MVSANTLLALTIQSESSMDSTLTSPVKLCSGELDASPKENLPALKGSQLHSLNYCVYLSTKVQGSWADPALLITMDTHLSQATSLYSD